MPVIQRQSDIEHIRTGSFERSLLTVLNRTGRQATRKAYRPAKNHFVKVLAKSSLLARTTRQGVELKRAARRKSEIAESFPPDSHHIDENQRSPSTTCRSERRRVKPKTYVLPSGVIWTGPSPSTPARSGGSISLNS